MTNTLGPAAVTFFETRGISPEIAAKYEIYTAARRGDEMVPAANGNVIVFPFFERDVVVNEKFRGPDKKFWQRKGGRKTFWNSDVLDDPALTRDHDPSPLIITEGEIDGLSAIECGFPFTVSVPDGAPPARTGNDELEPLDPEHEQTGKFEFLYNNRTRLRDIKRFTLAVDNDAAGQRLAAELVRRLGAARCRFVVYPEGCKDLNDVLREDGPQAVTAVLNAARPYPVRGLYRVSDYPDIAEVQTISTGWELLDDLDNGAAALKLFAGELMVVTGLPSSGKSTWVMNLLVNLGRLYGWRSVVFSPEMPTVPHLRAVLRRIVSNKDADPNPKVDAFIEDRFIFIDNDPAGNDDNDITLEWLMERASDAVMRDGVRVLLIDPWNEIEHLRARGETMHEYIGRSLRALKRFGRQYGVMVIVLAHPTKEVAKDGKSRKPTLYDIDGSAHFFNKSDHGIVISRHESIADRTLITVSKIRFIETGRRGELSMKFVVKTNRYEKLDASEPAEFAYDDF